MALTVDTLAVSPALISGYSDEGNYCNSSVVYINRKSAVMTQLPFSG